jgi:hypothetical protein
MRVIFAAIAIALAGAIASCSQPGPAQQAAAPLTYESPGPVTRAPLAPPAGYGSASAPAASSNEAAQLGWHASPRWSAIQGNGMLTDDGARPNLARKRNGPPESAEDASESEGSY